MKKMATRLSAAPALALLGILASTACGGPGPLTAISGGGSHICGLKPDGSPVCWGFGVPYKAGRPFQGQDKPLKKRNSPPSAAAMNTPAPCAGMGPRNAGVAT